MTRLGVHCRVHVSHEVAEAFYRTKNRRVLVIGIGPLMVFLGNRRVRRG